MHFGVVSILEFLKNNFEDFLILGGWSLRVQFCCDKWILVSFNLSISSKNIFESPFGSVVLKLVDLEDNYIFCSVFFCLILVAVPATPGRSGLHTQKHSWRCRSCQPFDLVNHLISNILASKLPDLTCLSFAATVNCFFPLHTITASNKTSTKWGKRF